MIIDKIPLLCLCHVSLLFGAQLPVSKPSVDVNPEISDLTASVSSKTTPSN